MRLRTEKLLVGTMVSLAVLVGFASSARASATIDLLWNGTTSELCLGFTSSLLLVLDVRLTAGAGGVAGYSFSLVYDANRFAVVETRSRPVVSPTRDSTAVSVASRNHRFRPSAALLAMGRGADAGLSRRTAS